MIGRCLMAMAAACLMSCADAPRLRLPTPTRPPDSAFVIKPRVRPQVAEHIIDYGAGRGVFALTYRSPANSETVWAIAKIPGVASAAVAGESYTIECVIDAGATVEGAGRALVERGLLRDSGKVM